jgi:YOP proteins translocation protein K (YscK)
MTFTVQINPELLAKTAFIRSAVWFNTRPVAYAHAAWWPSDVGALLQHLEKSDFSRVDVRDSDVIAEASRLWLESDFFQAKGRSLETPNSAAQTGHWLFEDSLEKCFLLEPSAFNDIVFDVGLSMHRTALLGILSGRAIRCLKQLCGEDRVDFVIGQEKSITDLLPDSFACIPERDFASLQPGNPKLQEEFRRNIESDGAITLVEAIADVSPAFALRAALRWPPSWSSLPRQLSWQTALQLRTMLNDRVLLPRMTRFQWLS